MCDRRIIRDGNRAGDVISRMRVLFKKVPAANESIDIKEVIQEVLVLTQGELQRNRGSLRTEFANGLPIKHLLWTHLHSAQLCHFQMPKLLGIFSSSGNAAEPRNR